MPVGAHGGKDINHHSAFRPRDGIVRDAARNDISVAGAEVARFAAHIESKRPLENDAHLFVGVLMLSNDRIRFQFDDRKRDFAPFHHSRDHTLPDGERRNVRQ